MKTWLVVRCAVVFALSMAAPLAAQGGAAGFWAGGGLGLGAASGLETLGIALAIDLNLHRAPTLISARTSIVAEVLGDGVADVGVLYGRMRVVGASSRSVAAGLGVVLFEDCPGGLSSRACEPDATFGIPFSARASLVGGGVIGVGIEILGNLNHRASFIAALARIELGSIR